MIFQKGKYYKSTTSEKKFNTLEEALEFEGHKNVPQNDQPKKTKWNYQEETSSPTEFSPKETFFESL